VTASLAAERQHLVFTGVTKWYGLVAALTDVSFAVGSEVVGLVGRNGVGKSTLLKLGAGLLRPSQGSVTVCGRSAASREAREMIGFCPDIERLYEDLTGREFVSWMLRFHGFSAQAARTRAADLLGELGLGDHMHRPVREYSKGMRQRVRLGQALAHRPRLVLLDEPMTGLDPVARGEIGRAIVALPHAGVGVLVSSHVLDELEATVDRVILVHQGRLLAEGRVADLREQMPEQPHRLRIVGARPRELAARVLAIPQVCGVEIVESAVVATVSGDAAFYRELTDLGAEWPGGISEISPVDASLAAVFGYLVS
jgi:ABC-2 type transport system ATP-binding protein